MDKQMLLTLLKEAEKSEAELKKVIELNRTKKTDLILFLINAKMDWALDLKYSITRMIYLESR